MSDPWGNPPPAPLDTVIQRFQRAYGAPERVDTAVALLGRLDAVARHDVNWVLEHDGLDEVDPEGVARFDDTYAACLYEAVKVAFAGFCERMVTGPVVQHTPAGAS